MTILGAALLDLAKESVREFVMCAPFAKQREVSRVLSAVPVGVRITLFTRWRPEEVAAGVSDTEVLSVIQERGGAVCLHDRLHAKFYRNESRALLGSANLTGAALGWSANSNIELLVESDDRAIQEVERRLAAESIQASDEIAREIEELAALLPAHVEIPEPFVLAGSLDNWIPSLRMPADLFTAYRVGTAALTSTSAAAAGVDLAVLDLPVGLEQDQFAALVGHRLRYQPIFKAIDEFLSEPRRFGEVRELISKLTGYDREEAEVSWQTIMRWMLEFLPQRYSRQVFRHSEMLSRVSGRLDCAL